MSLYQVLEREGATGRITRTFVYDRDGVTAYVPDTKGRIQKRFVYSHDRHEISELEGGRIENPKRVLSFSEGTAILAEGGRYRKMSRIYQFDADANEIREREGGRFGPVKRTLVFAGKAVVEKEGEEYSERRVFLFEKESPFITEKAGGWYGNVSRIFECEKIDPFIFIEPEAFLQLLFVVD